MKNWSFKNGKGYEVSFVLEPHDTTAFLYVENASVLSIKFILDRFTLVELRDRLDEAIKELEDREVVSYWEYYINGLRYKIVQESYGKYDLFVSFAKEDSPSLWVSQFDGWSDVMKFLDSIPVHY